jgi:hypothetical protein
MILWVKERENTGTSMGPVIILVLLKISEQGFF